jgi:sulfite exporter TauE/SafE
MMQPDPGSLSLLAALVAGLAASGHCLGMCGGIAGALAMRQPQAAFGAKLGLALAYNLSRVASYALAGALAGLLGRALLRAVDVAPLSIAFRVLAGLVMLAAAGRLLFGWRLLDPLEAAGARAWRRVAAPWANRRGRSGGIAGAVGLGLAWGWLPCGMTYSMLLLAATTASAATGAAVMLAFGLGTLPSMVTATVAFERMARTLASRATLRNIAGVLLLAFGLWTAGNALWHGLRHGSHAGHGGAPATVQDGSGPGGGTAPDEVDHSRHAGHGTATEDGAAPDRAEDHAGHGH